MKNCVFEIRENRNITDRIWKMTLTRTEDSCDSHGIMRPGQFVNVKLAGFFLRRPFSVCDWDRDNLTLLYKVVGKGTEAMRSYLSGTRLELLTPLGNGFSVRSERPTEGPVLVVGGGAGIPPLYGLCKALKAAGDNVTVLLGFNTAEEAFYIQEFKRLGVDVMVVTADGSLGRKGLVTDVIADISYSYFYACGPEAMLKALDQLIPSEIDGQMSFEERMGCGFGACMGCSCETKYGSKRICKEGPVLERSEILW